MKTFCDKLKASFALDRGEKAGPPGATEAGRQFEDSLRAMDHDLRASRGPVVVPTDLHAAIMRAVEQSRREPEPAALVFWWRGFAATALVLMVGLGVFWFGPRPSDPVAAGLPVELTPSFADAFDRGHELTQAAPHAVLEPLSGEMDLLNRDIRNAVNFLAANMP